MGLKLLVCLVALFAIQYCTYIEVQHYFDNYELSHQWDLTGWDSPGDVSNQIAVCSQNSIIGGYSYFGSGSYLENDSVPIPIQHMQIQIQFNLFQIDDWEADEEFQVYVDDVLVFSKAKENVVTQDICGNQLGPDLWEDQIHQVVLPPIAHTDPTVKIKFTSTLDEGAANESWGINELKIFAYVDCGNNYNWFNQSCVPQSYLQECYNELGQLDPTAYNNSDISNSCTWDEEYGEIVYYFEIEYIGDYDHDPFCVQNTIEIEGKILYPGNWMYQYDVWTWDPVEEKIYFKIKHSDLVGKYCCDFYSLPSKFKWKCEIMFRIWFDGVEQFCYTFTMKSILRKDIEDSTVVEVTKNVVEGECCNNYLEIETELLLCTDETCQSFYPTNLMEPKEYSRLDEIIVLHRIVTPEFQNYYVNVQQFLIGPFEPQTFTYDGSQPGGTIIKFNPSVAMDGIILKSIAIIQEGPSATIGPLRRDLQNSGTLNNEDGDLTLASTRQVTIRDPEDMSNYNQGSSDEFSQQTEDLIEAEEKRKQTYQMLMVLVGVVGTLLIGSVIAAIFYMKRLNTKRQEFQIKNNKLEQDSARSVNEN